MSHAESTAATDTHARTRRAADEIVITEDGRVLNDPTHAELPDHGNTPGGWIMAALAVLGTAVGAIALLMDLTFLVWVGVAMIVLGGIVGLVAARTQSRRTGTARHGH